MTLNSNKHQQSHPRRPTKYQCKTLNCNEINNKETNKKKKKED